MTWTYTLPIAADLDRVRFLIGDTVEAAPLVQNEEIAYALAEYTTVKLAAACVLRALCSRESDNVSVGSVSVSGSTDKWRALADQYDPSGLTLGDRLVLPVFGGQSLAEKETLDSDTDVPPAYFSRTLGDIQFDDEDAISDD